MLLRRPLINNYNLNLYCIGNHIKFYINTNIMNYLNNSRKFWKSKMNEWILNKIKFKMGITLNIYWRNKRMLQMNGRFLTKTFYHIHPCFPDNLFLVLVSMYEHWYHELLSNLFIVLLLLFIFNYVLDVCQFYKLFTYSW